MEEQIKNLKIMTQALKGAKMNAKLENIDDESERSSLESVDIETPQKKTPFVREDLNNLIARDISSANQGAGLASFDSKRGTHQTPT